MMSDHLCSMNETLSRQREEIDTLRLGGKVGCPLVPVDGLCMKSRSPSCVGGDALGFVSEDQRALLKGQTVFNRETLSCHF